ncbi:hypothetical protein BH10ACT8_BH10ACT8_07670 [soil metagenome]
MASRQAGRARIGLAALTVPVALLVAGCGSTGVKTQTPTSADPSTAPTATTGASSSTSNPSTSKTPTTPPPSTGFGAAQPAVDIVLKVQLAYSTAVRDPARSSTKDFDLMLGGQAKNAFDSSFAAAKSSGVFYKGTPPTARIKVLSNQVTASPPHVQLVNCPLASASDPFVAYYTATGKRVAVGVAKVPPPYAQTAKVFKVNGRWVITQFTTDNSKTCSP